ncbi:MAG: ABC transporter permease subunit [Gammaproteobacteria bacterium]|nr:ABC transporter permease subunit [Gammaproteobacteria bacterium]NIM73691.1 ABC transporter permease subunit [Gammaproteobacteria bacterium]NIN37365.1 ABC transporter permease subunit [Gammaproteobacteria bacterium]NIO25524.1 ABC transporter permease subunit [Gammaproteobacteria bacterium]NIO66199.1 ABC transporter permease subunit [Gammaproteobacteria bacterium]
MISFLTARLTSALVVVLGVACLVFLLIHLVPGDPVEVMLGESARASDRAALREALGLDKPLLSQLLSYLESLLRLDPGESLYSKRPISEILAERLPATALLAVVALLVAVAIAFPMGVLAALRQNTAWDFGAMGVSMVGVSIPNFVMGPVLILLFSFTLGWFPVSGMQGPASIVLPALTLGTALAAILSRMVRAALLEVLNEDYVRTARAKGLSEFRVITRHALRNATLPILTLIGLQLGTLLGGAVITEMVFAWPGIGQLTVEAIQRRDYPLLQACVLVISVAYVTVNTLTDVLYGWLDPRIRIHGDA